MKHITVYLDFISPYACLAFEGLPEALSGVSYSASYTPVLFAGLLKHHGQLGQAEIAASHPFNPLPLLRLALACSPGALPGHPNRYVCETIFRHVWRGAAEAADGQRLEALVKQLNPPREVNSEAVKAQLKTNTDHAIAQGVFGVPTFVVDDKLFWGLDALAMLRDYLQGEPWFDGPDWNGVQAISGGAERRRPGFP